MKKYYLISFVSLLVLLSAGAANTVFNYYGQTFRYRGGSVISMDATTTLRDEDSNWVLTHTELGYLATVTSDVQNQINSLQGSGGFTNSVLTNATFKGGYITNSTAIATPVITGGTITGATVTNASIIDGTATNVTFRGGYITNSTAIATPVITGGTVNGSTITNASIIDGGVTNATIRGGIVTGSTITNAAIVDGTMTNAAISGGTIVGAAVSDGTITNAVFKGGVITNSTAINTPFITDGTITNVAIKGGTLTNTVFQDLSTDLPVFSGSTGKLESKALAPTLAFLGLDCGTAVMSGDGSVTQAFSFTFLSAPVVVSTPIGAVMTTNSIVRVTTTNVVFNLGDGAASNHWIAFKKP